jgi:hypothetical protein
MTRASRRAAFAALAIFAALAAFAGSASAAATTTKAEWYTGATEGSVTTTTSSPALTAAASGKLELTVPYVGTPVKFQVGAASCVECTITNESALKPGAATGTGRLLFSGVVITSPAGPCRVKEGKITSSPLSFEAHYMAGERWFLRIAPVSGETALTLNIEGEPGRSCPISATGTPIKGANFGEFKARTSSFATEQSVLFSTPISELGGSHWSFFGEAVSLAGTLNLKVGGLFFGVK